MLIEFLILFEIIAIVILMMAFYKGGIVPYAVCIVLFAVLALSFFNVEETKTLVHSVTDTTINASTSTSVMSYTQFNEQSKDTPLAFLNMGLGGLALVFFFIEIFKEA
jgi:hypothetical protein